MNKADGYLFRGDAFSSKQAAIEILVHDREQELRFHETWEKEAKPYFFNDNQPKLSIPKKIAELLDIGYACEGDEERDHSWLIHNMDDFISSESYDEFYSWLEDSEDNYSLAIVYLAGKALGVELVEVTDE